MLIIRRLKTLNRVQDNNMTKYCEEVIKYELQLSDSRTRESHYLQDDGGTFTVEYDTVFEEGTFICRKYNTPLFSSKDKFNFYFFWIDSEHIYLLGRQISLLISLM